MSVREQDAREAFEPDARLQDLALGPLAAVHEEAILIVADDLRRKPALGRWGGCGSTEEKNFEQDESCFFAADYTDFHRLKICVIRENL
jgi:hypothetical protein